MPAKDVVVLPLLGPQHAQPLLQLFAEQWWTSQRSSTQVAGLVRSSTLVFSAVHTPSDELVGFARVLTDGVTLALVLDVMVSKRWRGRGVGGRLMDAVVVHPLVADVESVELVCQPELVPFYAQWGFTDQVGASRLLRRTTRAELLGAPT